MDLPLSRMQLQLGRDTPKPDEYATPVYAVSAFRKATAPFPHCGLVLHLTEMRAPGRPRLRYTTEWLGFQGRAFSTAGL